MIQKFYEVSKCSKTSRFSKYSRLEIFEAFSHLFEDLTLSKWRTTEESVWRTLQRVKNSSRNPFQRDILAESEKKLSWLLQLSALREWHDTSRRACYAIRRSKNSPAVVPSCVPTQWPCMYLFFGDCTTAVLPCTTRRADILPFTSSKKGNYKLIQKRTRIQKSSNFNFLNYRSFDITMFDIQLMIFLQFKLTREKKLN